MHSVLPVAATPPWRSAGYGEIRSVWQPRTDGFAVLISGKKEASHEEKCKNTQGKQQCTGNWTGSKGELLVRSAEDEIYEI